MGIRLYHSYYVGDLGWRPESDRSYLDKYPLTVATIPSVAQPVVIGVPWYSTFDAPKQDGIWPWSRWWIGRNKDIGFIRGGHAICVLPGNTKDQWNWWKYYNQGMEGACVGFSLSRAVSLMNRRMYDARWLYREGQLVDEWDETPPEEGTSVNAGCKVLVTKGHRRLSGDVVLPEDIGEGIAAYRWARNMDDVFDVLKNPDANRLGAIPLLNSWGTDYPRKVWLPGEVAERIIFDEYGECAILTDR